jgi:valyl-tRNA synthetase
VAPWPSPEFTDPGALKYGNMSLGIIEEARRFKSENNLSMAASLVALEVQAPAEDLQGLKMLEDDLLSVTRAESIQWIQGDELKTRVLQED